MNTYIIDTTTDEAWEIIGGTYIVNALTKKLALEYIKEMVEDTGGRIVEIKKLNLTRKGVIFEQYPIIE